MKYLLFFVSLVLIGISLMICNFTSEVYMSYMYKQNDEELACRVGLYSFLLAVIIVIAVFVMAAAVCF